MGRLIILLVASIMTIFPLVAQETISLKAGGIPTSTGTQVTMPQRSVEEDSSGVTVTYTFSTAQRYEDPLYPNQYMWSIPGFGKCGESGKPATLLRTDLINIPDNMQATVTLVDASFVEYKDLLSPAREPLSDATYEGYSRANVKQIETYSGFFPAKTIEAGKLTAYRGSKILPIEIRPIQYSVRTGTIKVYTKLKFRVNFVREITSGKDNGFKARYMSASDPMLRNSTINHQPLPELEKSVEDTKDYLIITASDFESAAERFAELKRLMGFNTQIISRDDWTPEVVQRAIKNHYATHPNLYYFVIIGDHQHVPSNSLTNKRSHLSDRPYGCMDDASQIIPDLFRGRLSVSTEDEAEVVVDKIINYELNPVKNAEFYTTGLNCAYFQDTDNHDGIADRRFAQTAEEILVYLQQHQGFKMDRVYYTEPDVNPHSWNNDTYSFGEIFPDYLKKPGFPWDGNSNDIIRHINDGVNIVLHRDHGSSYGWSDPSLYKGDIHMLNNGRMQPIVFSLNCKTGMMNVTGGSFAETFLRHDAGGCVGIVAATETSYSGYNDSFACGMYDAIWPKPGLIPRIPGPNQTVIQLSEPIYQLGAIFDQGQFRMGEHYGFNDEWNTYSCEIFHFYGDPSMEVYTANPTEFSNVTISRVGTVDINVPDVQNVRISFIDNNSSKVTSFIGNSVSFPCENPENITVSIRAHNKIPFIDYGKLSAEYIQNEIVSGFKTYSSGRIIVGSKVTDAKPVGKVSFNGGDVTLKANEIIIEGETTVAKGTRFSIEPR